MSTIKQVNSFIKRINPFSYRPRGSSGQSGNGIPHQADHDAGDRKQREGGPKGKPAPRNGPSGQHRNG